MSSPTVYTPVGNDFNDPGLVGVVLTEESQEYIRQNAEKVPLALQGDPPQRIDPTPWLAIENQAQQGSCRGHSGTSIYELCFYWSNSAFLQFSRQHLYIAAQMADGFAGDRGSTISGGFKVMREGGKGLLPEKHWPYTGQYVRVPPIGWAAADAISKHYHAAKLLAIPDFQAALAFLQTRQGGIDAGFAWSGLIDEQAARTGVIERWSAGSGGHALAFVGYERITHKGKLQWALKMVNSWSKRWGKNGTCLWLEDAFNSMVEHRWSEVGAVAGVVLGPEAEIPDPGPLWASAT